LKFSQSGQLLGNGAEKTCSKTDRTIRSPLPDEQVRHHLPLITLFILAKNTWPCLHFHFAYELEFFGAFLVKRKPPLSFAIAAYFLSAFFVLNLFESFSYLHSGHHLPLFMFVGFASHTCPFLHFHSRWV
jgi:hypothetical protein